MLILIFLLLFVVVIFAVQNSQLVSVSFLSWSFTTNQALVILASLFLGLLIGWVWSWFRGAKVRGQVRQLNKALDEAKQKLAVWEEKVQAQRQESALAEESESEIEV
jgi:putative membrane protein